MWSATALQRSWWERKAGLSSVMGGRRGGQGQKVRFCEPHAGHLTLASLAWTASRDGQKAVHRASTGQEQVGGFTLLLGGR